MHLVAAARDFAPLNRDLLRLRRGGGADLWGGGQCFGADLAAFGAGLGAAVCGVRCHLEGVGGVGIQLADGAGSFVTFDRSYLGCFWIWCRSDRYSSRRHRPFCSTGEPQRPQNGFLP